MSYYVEPISLTAEIEARLADKADALTVRMTVGELRAIVAALKAETARADRYAERLEITSHWVSYDDGATLTRVEVPREDWDGQHDGIDCRDETIKLQDAAVDNLRAQLTAANEKLAAQATAEKDAADQRDWINFVSESLIEPTPALRAMWQKYKDSQHPVTGDGNGRT